MLKETAVGLLYLKGLYAITYPMWILGSYKYDYLTKLYNRPFSQLFVNSITTRYPKLFGLTRWLYLTSEAFAGKTIGWIQTSSLIDTNKYIGNYVKEICPQRLTRSIIHASITCKLLFPVYCIGAYGLTKYTFKENKKIKT